MNQRGPAFSRAVYVALALVALLGVVGVASRGHAPVTGGSAQSRVPTQIFFDIVFTLAIVGGAATVFMLAFFQVKTQKKAREVTYRSIIVITGVVALFLIVAITVLDNLDLGPSKDNADAVTGQVGNVRDSALKQAQEPELHWPVMLGTAALAIAGIALVLLRERSRRRESARERALAEQLADLLDDTLDDLRDEPDARRAVIAAYARMERAFGLHGLPRREADAPLEYLARVLRDLQASEEEVRTLTELFAVAKFSDHRIDDEMKEQAIQALESIRDDLRAVSSAQPPELDRVPTQAEVAS